MFSESKDQKKQESRWSKFGLWYLVLRAEGNLVVIGYHHCFVHPGSVKINTSMVIMRGCVNVPLCTVECHLKVPHLPAYPGRLLCLHVADGGEAGHLGRVQRQAGHHLPDLLLLLDACPGLLRRSDLFIGQLSPPGGQLHLCPPAVQGDLYRHLQVANAPPTFSRFQILF